jgi:hypothetical protein
MVLKRLLFFTALAITAAAQKRAMTHEDVFLLKRTGEPAVSPDTAIDSPGFSLSRRNQPLHARNL